MSFLYSAKEYFFVPIYNFLKNNYNLNQLLDSYMTINYYFYQR